MNLKDSQHLVQVFVNNGSQDFLIFQLIFNTFTMLAKHFPNTVIDWESEGLSN